MEKDLKKKRWYRKPKGFLIIFLIILANTIFNSIRSNDLQQNNTPPEKIVMKPIEPIVIPGFELYTDKSKGLQVLFPEQPEVTTFKLLGEPSTHYQSLSVLDDNNFTQYSVTYTDSEIYNTESINAYLNSHAKGKVLGLGYDAKIITNDITRYKEFPAQKYLIEYTMDGVKIKNMGIDFIANGDSISLSVSYPSTMNADDTYFNEFTDSFLLK